MHQLTIMILVLFLLCACSQDSETQPGSDFNAEGEKPLPEQAITPVEKKATVKEQAKEKPLDKKPDLDLSLPQLPLDQNHNDSVEDPELLPDLFIKKKKDSRISIGGGLLRNEEGEGFIESIEGAELSIETKVD